MKTFAMLALCCTLITQQVLAQFADDFSDRDLTANPPWIGSDFIINDSDQLQLNKSTAGTSSLVVSFSFIALGASEWRFNIRQYFEGSGGNYSRVYLFSDQQDLAGSVNGYYLQFGEAGTNDAVKLMRQTGTTGVIVCQAAAGGIANAFNIGVKVNRSVNGEWQLAVDYSGGTNYITSASGTDNTHVSASYFGIRCVYTITNSKNFIFDDFQVTALPAPDVVPPFLISLIPLSPTTLQANFSEDLNPATATSLSNYIVNGTSHPVGATLHSDQRTVALTFPQAFVNGATQTLSVEGVADLAGNSMPVTPRDFVFFQPVPAAVKDIVINEIFADISPSNGLPEAEFVEVFNRSQHPFDLQDWQITDGAAAAKLPSLMLLPGEYAILTTTASKTLFSVYGKTLGVPSFPTLNNAGDAIRLKDPEGQLIDSVNYSDTWYNDDEKKEGGWTLERIDSENLCAEATNWTSSEVESGGTPGSRNSVFAHKPDAHGPALLSVIPVTPAQLQIHFDEKLDKQLPPPEDFLFDPPLTASTVSFGDISQTSLLVTLEDALRGGQKYSLTLENIYDCAGNTIAEDHRRVSFALPEQPDSADVIINEILFNPRSTGVDFVEVYNRSSKYINLKNWTLANLDDEGNKATIKTITGEHLLLEPAAYVVFTEDGHILKGEYLQGREETFWNMTMPAFPDDEGSVVFMDSAQKVIDVFSYSDKMHSVFIRDSEGVSLERISTGLSAIHAQHWKSASSVAGFATPGYLNSNDVTTTATDAAILVEPEIFTPELGQPDFAQVKYNFDQGGYVANVTIFDPQGRAIKALASNAVLGTEGFFRWDGDDDNGSRARIGAYMVWFEVFDDKGMVKTYRKRVVVAGSRQ